MVKCEICEKSFCKCNHKGYVDGVLKGKNETAEAIKSKLLLFEGYRLSEEIIDGVIRRVLGD